MTSRDDAENDARRQPLDEADREETHESSVGSTPGAPAWPNPAPGSTDPATVPVVLNWQVVAEQLGVDLRILRHDGLIVVAGEYFPAVGYFFDPATLQGRRVDVGDIALHHGYFVAEITLRQFKASVPSGENAASSLKRMIPSTGRGPVIGLFADAQEASRARERILRGSLGAGTTVDDSPLGIELRVSRPLMTGRVASVIASHGGGVIAIDGRPVTELDPVRGPLATGAPAGPGDARRPGTGVTGDSAGPEIPGVTEAGRRTLEEFRTG